MKKEHQARHYREEQPNNRPVRKTPSHAAGGQRVRREAGSSGDPAPRVKYPSRVSVGEAADRSQQSQRTHVQNDSSFDVTPNYIDRGAAAEKRTKAKKPSKASKLSNTTKNYKVVKDEKPEKAEKIPISERVAPVVEPVKAYFADGFSIKKMWPVLALAIVVVVTASIVVAAVVSAHVGKVPQAQVSAATTDSVTLSWEKVDHADGYYIYARKAGDEQYAQVATVMEPNPSTYTVGKLDQASEYSFYVIAFNDSSKSGGFTPVEGVWTLPQKTDITTVTSDVEGVIHVEWLANDKAAGYCIEYQKAETEDAPFEQKWVEGGTATAADIEGVEPYLTYNVRVAPYINTTEKLLAVMSEPKQIKVHMNIRENDRKPLDESIDPTRPMIAFSFDDGPSYSDSGERILNTLEQYGAKATFFMVGYNATRSPENLKRKVALGMELGNHTWDHEHYGDDVTAEDISKASEAVFNITGKYPTAFRSPGGMTTETIRRECAAEGMPLYYWTIDTNDWDVENHNATDDYNAVMSSAEDGAIILMHEIYDSTADAVAMLVPALQQQGYQIVTCHDLLLAKSANEPVPGEEYRSAYSTTD